MHTPLSVDAMHEASHGVIGVALGLPVVRVTLDPPETLLRRTTQHRERILTVLAGRYGEMLLGVRFDDMPVVKFEDEVRAAHWFLRHLRDKNNESFVDLHRTAKRLVGRYHAYVYRVARALQGQGTLTGPDVENLLGITS
jgi:hypothetical protein